MVVSKLYISIASIVLLSIVIDSVTAYYVSKDVRKVVRDNNKRSFKPIKSSFNYLNDPIRNDLDSLQPMRNNLEELDRFQPIDEDFMDFNEPMKVKDGPFRTRNNKRNFNERNTIEPIENNFVDFDPISEDLNQIEPINGLDYDNNWRENDHEVMRKRGCGPSYCDGQWRLCDHIAKDFEQHWKCNVQLFNCNKIRCN